jgi:ligand-binding SRPBCC domain-containing protein
MKETNEKAVGGRTSGQIKLNESVIWNAKHFGFNFSMTVQITDLLSPLHFTDEMIKGPFKYFRHQHLFEKTHEGTMITDLFDFQSPFGMLGRIADKVFLERYMRKLLAKRNCAIKIRAAFNKDLTL